MSMIFFWIVIFIVSLLALIKGADWLLESSERIGLALGLSSFIIGVIIVGVGTSLPELFSSLVAVFKQTPEIVPANAVGSNIANILLITGISAIVARKLFITKNLIDLELPIFALGTTVFLFTAFDGVITLLESIILVVTYGVYLLYTLLHKDDDHHSKDDQKTTTSPVALRDVVMLIIGAGALALGANYLVDSVIQLSQLLNIAVGAITITAVAIGTSLPELLVSVKAARRGDSEVALGNIFGSNAFNMMMVVGIPGLFARIPFDQPTFVLGLPVLAVVSLLFVISAISRRIHLWEGVMFLGIYIIFMGKLFNLL